MYSCLRFLCFIANFCISDKFSFANRIKDLTHSQIRSNQLVGYGVVGLAGSGREHWHYPTVDAVALSHDVHLDGLMVIMLQL